MIQVGGPPTVQALSDSKVNLGNPNNPVDATYSGGGTGTIWDFIWTRSSGKIYPTTIADKVSLGTTTFIGSEKLRVLGETNTDTLRTANAYIDTARLRSGIYYANLAATSLTATRTIYLPNKNGTVVLDVDLPANLTLLSTYNQTNANITSAISLSHTHSNISTLNSITPTNYTNWNTAFSWGDWHGQGFLTAETDPIFAASVASTISSLDYTHWTTSYGWGNHALVGYLTVETDPIFAASQAAAITDLMIADWNHAFNVSHTHSNQLILDDIIGSGLGDQFLGNDGLYHTISTTAGGTDTQVQFNDGGILAGSAALTFVKGTGTLTVYDTNITNRLYLDGATSYITDVSGDLTFTDTATGSKTLSQLAAGATNYWTATTGGIYYSSYISNHTNPTAELDITGHIIADNFDSNYFRYYDDSLLIGPNLATVGSNKLSIDNTSTAYPLIYGEFDNRLLTFNGEVTLGYGILNFNSGNNQIYEDSGFLYIRDPNINSGTPVTFASFLDGSVNMLVSEFTDLSAVISITAALMSQWNTAYANNHVHIDNILDWNNTSKTYQPFTTKQGTTLSFDTSADIPTGTTRVNLNGDLHVTTLDVAGKLTVGGLIDPIGLQLTPVAANPGDANTIWSNSGVSNTLHYGTNKLGLSQLTGLTYNPANPFLFDNSYQYNNYTVSANITPTLSLTGAVALNMVLITFVGDGTHTVDFSNFVESSASGTFDSTLGTENQVVFCYDGYDVYYAISADLKIDNVTTTNRLLGRISSGAGVIEELTGTQATTLLDNFTTALKGLTPASGGGTANFLRADGTWAAPSTGVTPTDGILDWVTDKYQPYATQQASLSFDTSTDTPTGTTRLNINGKLVATILETAELTIAGATSGTAIIRSNAIAGTPTLTLPTTTGTLALTSDISTSVSNYLPLAGGIMVGNILMTSNKLIGGSTTTSDLFLQTTTGVGGTGADMHFLVGNNGATEAMTILNNGNVGIGTTTPGFSLVVSGKADGLNKAVVGNIEIGDWNTGGGYAGYAMIKHKNVNIGNFAFIQDGDGNTYFNAASQLNFGLGATGRLRLETGGSGYIFSPRVNNVVDLGTPSLYFAKTYTTNLYTSGNVGIRNATPTELLTIGTAGTTAGTLSLAGLTSGKAIIQTSAIAGTPTLTLPTTTGTLALTTNIPTLTDDILDWSTDKYTPYAAQQAFLSFDTSTTAPTLTTRINLNGSLYTTSLIATSSIGSPYIAVDTTGSIFANGLQVSGATVTGISVTNTTTGTGIVSNTYSGTALSVGTSTSTPTVNSSSSIAIISKVLAGTYNNTGKLLELIDNPTTSGTVSGALISGIIGSTERFKVDPRVAASGTSIAYMFDTHNTLTSGDNLLTIRNNGNNRFLVGYNGGVTAFGGFYSYSDASNYSYYNTNLLNFVNNSVTRTNLYPGVADGASAVAYMFDTHNALSTSGAKIVSFKNAGTEHVYIDKDGIIYSNTSIKLGASTQLGSSGNLFLSTYSELLPTVSNGSTALAFKLNTQNTLSTAGAKLISIQNNTVERFRVTPTTTDIPCGTSTTFATIGGTLKDFYTDASTSETDETDLYSYTVPTNVLANNGDKLIAEFTVNSIGATGSLHGYFAGNSLASPTLTSSTTAIKYRMEIFRVSSTTFRYSVYYTVGGGGTTAYVYNEVGSEDWTATNILKITGQCSAGSLTARMGYIEYKPAALN